MVTAIWNFARPAGSARRCALEHRAAPRGHERVIGQVLAVLVVDCRAGLAQQSEGLGLA
jgi:hypothetical protein